MNCVSLLTRPTTLWTSSLFRIQEARGGFFKTRSGVRSSGLSCAIMLMQPGSAFSLSVLRASARPCVPPIRCVRACPCLKALVEESQGIILSSRAVSVRGSFTLPRRPPPVLGVGLYLWFASFGHESVLLLPLPVLVAWFLSSPRNIRPP